jgi:hypothetical protein
MARVGLLVLLPAAGSLEAKDEQSSIWHAGDAYRHDEDAGMQTNNVKRNNVKRNCQSFCIARKISG